MKYDKGTFVVVPNIQKMMGKKAVHQALFMWLCVYADEEGKCFPSRTTLSKNLRVSIKTIDRYIQQLIDLGFVNKEVRKIPGARNLTNVYQVMIINDKEGDKRDPQEGDKKDTEVGTNGLPRRGTNGLQELYPLLTQSNEDIYTSSFHTFWDIYPKKIGKKPAAQKWAILMRDKKPNNALQQKILADISNRKIKDNLWLTGFAQHPTTYLNQESWNDEEYPKAPVKKAIVTEPDGPYKKGKYKDDVSQVVKN